jgi:hypothetical protein
MSTFQGSMAKMMTNDRAPVSLRRKAFSRG